MTLALSTALGEAIDPIQVRTLLLGSTRDIIRNLPLN